VPRAVRRQANWFRGIASRANFGRFERPPLKGLFMKLSTLAVVHARNEGFGDPLIHCHAGKQLVLTYVARKALEDYFRVPGGTPVTLQQWNLVVDRSLFQIERIEALGEPAVDRSEKFASLIPLALIAPEPRRAHRGAKFPGFGLLLMIVRIGTHVFALEAQGTALRGQRIPTLAPVLPLKITLNARRAAAN
jgi:hypothetical protein